jgi:hypothetical protein
MLVSRTVRLCNTARTFSGVYTLDSGGRRVRDWLEEEFFAEAVVVAGNVHSVPKSTRDRKALQALPERVLAWLQENHAPLRRRQLPRHQTLAWHHLFDGRVKQ